MKKNFPITILFLILFSSCKKELIVLEPINHLKEFSKTEKQTFDLDTLDFYRIEGKYGTEIIFIRDAFEVQKGEKIIAELKEIYDFNELLFNNINTITVDNELLESSGVIYLDFKTKDKSISLKNGKSLQVYFPEGVLDNNDLYTATLNEFNQFKWEEEEQLDTIYPIHRGGGIFVDEIVSKDSIEYYKKNNQESFGRERFDDLLGRVDSIVNNRYSTFGLFKNIGWINVDLIVEPDFNLNLNLVENKGLENLSFYVLYEDLNSFLSIYRTRDSLFFEDIPIKNKTQLIIIGNEKEQLYGDKIELNEINQNSSIKLNLKKMTKEEINEKLIK